MCIICYKPFDKVLAWNTVEIMAHNNDDGFGYMFLKGGYVNGEKGFMTPAVLQKSLVANNLIDDDGNVGVGKAVILHFRVATHGGIKPTMCHPFPLSPKPELLESLSWKHRFGLAHNGIISGYGTKGYAITPTESDTMAFCRLILADGILQGLLTHKPFLDLLQMATKTNKFAILQAFPKNEGGFVHLIGDFIKGLDDNIYSNSTYEKKLHRYTTYYGSNHVTNKGIVGASTAQSPYTGNVGRYSFPNTKIVDTCTVDIGSCYACTFYKVFRGGSTIPTDFCSAHQKTRTAIWNQGNLGTSSLPVTTVKEGD
jgi:predicted glutamine amidotransferase